MVVNLQKLPDPLLTSRSYVLTTSCVLMFLLGFFMLLLGLIMFLLGLIMAFYPADTGHGGQLVMGVVTEVAGVIREVVVVGMVVVVVVGVVIELAEAVVKCGVIASGSLRRKRGDYARRQSGRSH